MRITTIYMPLVRTPMIAPTKMYDRFPTITPEEAADMICEAIIYRPKRIATPLGTLGRDALRDQPEVDRLHPEHAPTSCSPTRAAARGEKKDAQPGSRPPANEEASRQQVAFAYLMRGVHW